MSSRSREQWADPHSAHCSRLRLVFGDVNADRTLIIAGIIALALSSAGFFLMGVISERLPLGHLETYRQPLAAVASVIVAAVEFCTGETLLILAGTIMTCGEPSELLMLSPVQDDGRCWCTSGQWNGLPGKRANS